MTLDPKRSDHALLSESVREYTTCLGLEVTFPGGMNNLGNALKEQDNLRDALRAWQVTLLGFRV